MDFEMKVGTGRASCIAHFRNLHPLAHFCADADIEGAQVGIKRCIDLPVNRVRDHNGVSVRAERRRKRDDAVCGGDDWRAG